MNGFPITNYQINQVKRFLRAFVTITTVVILFGNIINALLKNRIKVDPASYILRDGFPLFTSERDYVELLRNYPYDIGIEIKFHKMKSGESYWDVSRKYQISIDTILASNPFLKTLLAIEGTEIVIPSEDGVLVAIDDADDVPRMTALLGKGKNLTTNYKHSLFEILSLDDIRFVFFKDAKPVIVSSWLQQLYNIRRFFQTPVRGRYTSLYGHRYDPMFKEVSFHNGVDIVAKMGTPIHPAADGIVRSVGWLDGYGLSITILHRNGYISMYGHCSSIKVKKGDRVNKKTVIGLLGSTGRSTGPHLHFSMRRHGKSLDPLLFIW
jgi:murein DD-endopeptidase MepM/ murein hydrolase activator NlpD